MYYHSSFIFWEGGGPARHGLWASGPLDHTYTNLPAPTKYKRSAKEIEHVNFDAPCTCSGGRKLNFMYRTDEQHVVYAPNDSKFAKCKL